MFGYFNPVISHFLFLSAVFQTPHRQGEIPRFRYAVQFKNSYKTNYKISPPTIRPTRGALEEYYASRLSFWAVRWWANIKLGARKLKSRGKNVYLSITRTTTRSISALPLISQHSPPTPLEEYSATHLSLGEVGRVL